MLYFWIDNIIHVFMLQQTSGIPIGTNYATLVAYLFLHDLLQGLKDRKLAQTFNCSFLYVCSVTDEFSIV
jgi:hypothetical protein